MLQQKGADQGVSQGQDGAVFAGFWRRVAAAVIDSACITVVELVTVVVLFLLDRMTMRGTMLKEAYTDWLSLLIFWLYYAGMESSPRQATLGKLTVGIKVTSSEGSRLSFLRATGRTFGKFLSVLTLGIGFLMAGFTRRKQALHDLVAGCVVVKYRKSYFGRVVLITGFCCLLLIGGLSAYLYYVKVPQWTRSFTKQLTAVSEPTKISGIQPLPEKVVSRQTEPVSVTEADYDHLLLSQSVPSEEGVSASVGPAAFQLSKFWDYDKNDPNAWIEIRMVPLPNFDLPTKLARLTIDHMWDKSGRDVYNPDSTFETETFQHLSFSEREHPTPHFHAIRSVHLYAGTTEDDIVRAEGKFVLKLPIKVQVLTFTAEMLGQEKTIQGITVSLAGMSGSEVLIKYKGPPERYVATLAYNAAGEQLESSMYSFLTGFKEESADLKHVYAGVVKTVRVVVASYIAQREYPFTLSK